MFLLAGIIMPVAEKLFLGSKTVVFLQLKGVKKVCERKKSLITLICISLICTQSLYYRPQLYNTYETRLMSQEASMPQLPLQSVIYCPAPPTLINCFFNYEC